MRQNEKKTKTTEIQLIGENGPCGALAKQFNFLNTIATLLLRAFGLSNAFDF